MRCRDYVNGNEFANTACRGSTSVSSGFHGTDVAADRHGHKSGADVFFRLKPNIGSFHHCVSSFYCAYKSLCFD